MRYIPPIPSHAKLSHKNYELAEKLAKITAGFENVQKPSDKMSEENWKKFQEAYAGFLEKNKKGVEGMDVWDVVESFFVALKEMKKSPADVEDILDINGAFSIVDDVDTNVEVSEKSFETYSIMLEEKMDLGNMAEKEKKAIMRSGIKMAKENVRKIDAVLENSVSFIRSRKFEVGNDYRNIDVMKATIKDLARVNEKYMRATEELELLMIYRAVNGELTAQKPSTPSDKMLFVMVDDSGSMNDTEKKAYVSLIMDRLKRMKKKDKKLRIFVYRFEADLYDDEEELQENNMPKFSFGGGGTDVNTALKTLYGKIRKEKNINPELASILVINDGEDRVWDNDAPVKVNAITLKRVNFGLKELCGKTNGKYTTVK